MSENKYDSYTTYVGKTLHDHYCLLLDEWGRRRETDPSLELSPEFSLFKVTNNLETKKGAKSRIQFLSDFGFLEILIWCSNSENKTLVSSAVIYTQGADRSVRGKGGESLKKLRQIFQTVSNQTGYTIYDIVLPNEVSIKSLTPDLGYEYLDPIKRQSISQIIAPDDAERWEELLRVSRCNPAQLKIYSPEKESTDFSAKEKNEAEKIARVVGL